LPWAAWTVSLEILPRPFKDYQRKSDQSIGSGDILKLD
jgi:hypothetical protein